MVIKFIFFRSLNIKIEPFIYKNLLQTLKLLLDKFKYFYIPNIRMKYSVVFNKNLKYKGFLSKNKDY